MPGHPSWREALCGHPAWASVPPLASGNRGRRGRLGVCELCSQEPWTGGRGVGARLGVKGGPGSHQDEGYRCFYARLTYQIVCKPRGRVLSIPLPSPAGSTCKGCPLFCPNCRPSWRPSGQRPAPPQGRSAPLTASSPFSPLLPACAHAVTALACTPTCPPTGTLTLSRPRPRPHPPSPCPSPKALCPGLRVILSPLPAPARSS